MEYGHPTILNTFYQCCTTLQINQKDLEQFYHQRSPSLFTKRSTY